MKLTSLTHFTAAQRTAAPQQTKSPEKTAQDPADKVSLEKISNPNAGEPYEPDFITPKAPTPPSDDYAGEPYAGTSNSHSQGLNAGIRFDPKTGTLNFNFPPLKNDGTVPNDILVHERAAERAAEREMVPNPNFGEPYEPAEVAAEAPQEAHIFPGYS